MPKIDSNSTFIDREEDKVYLKSKLLPVSIRLFFDSPRYRKLIWDICTYMEDILKTEYDDYPTLHGISGANLGIPFNIIGFNTKDGQKVMVNPVITERIGGLVKANSNCGSVRLKESIEIVRNESVRVKYFDPDLERELEEVFDRNSGSFTIQHEVDHNLGILITDRTEIIFK